MVDVRGTLTIAPELDGFSSRLLDEHSIEFDLAREQTLNEVFAQLQAKGLEVVSIRPKTNRLEELFVDLTTNSKQEAGA